MSPDSAPPGMTPASGDAGLSFRKEFLTVGSHHHCYKIKIPWFSVLNSHIAIGCVCRWELFWPTQPAVDGHGGASPRMKTCASGGGATRPGPGLVPVVAHAVPWRPQTQMLGREAGA